MRLLFLQLFWFLFSKLPQPKMLWPGAASYFAWITASEPAITTISPSRSWQMTRSQALPATRAKRRTTKESVTSIPHTMTCLVVLSISSRLAWMAHRIMGRCKSSCEVMGGMGSTTTSRWLPRFHSDGDLQLSGSSLWSNFLVLG